MPNLNAAMRKRNGRKTGSGRNALETLWRKWNKIPDSRNTLPAVGKVVRPMPTVSLEHTRTYNELEKHETKKQSVESDS